MMKRSLLPLFPLLFLTSLLPAQGFPSVDIVYATKVYNNTFNKVRFLNSLSLENPVQFVGLGMGGGFPLDGKSDSYIYNYSNYCQVIPVKVLVNDSLSCNLTGYMLKLFSVPGPLVFSQSEYFNIGILPWAGFGRLKLSGDGSIKQKNAFVIPSLSIHPRLRIGSITISAIAEYGWDISRYKWKRLRNSESSQVTLDDFNQSGFTAMLCIGYRIMK